LLFRNQGLLFRNQGLLFRNQGLLFRNLVIKAFAIPGLAGPAGRDIAGTLNLPEYGWPSLDQLAARLTAGSILVDETARLGGGSAISLATDQGRIYPSG
jgi:hypothetical protein